MELLQQQIQTQMSALTAEKIKHDDLQEKTDNLKEQIKIREKKLKEDEEEVKKQDAALLALQGKIDAELLIQKDQSQKFEEQLQLNEVLEKKQRENALTFAALEQQLKWIQINTDFKNNVKAVDMAVFKELVETNNEVRNKVIKVLGKQNDLRLGDKDDRRQEGGQRDGDQTSSVDRNQGGGREEEVSTTLAESLAGSLGQCMACTAKAACG